MHRANVRRVCLARSYLQLKMRLTPYQYTYSRIAHDTGLPPIRAMALEFPEVSTRQQRLARLHACLTMPLPLPPVPVHDTCYLVVTIQTPAL